MLPIIESGYASNTLPIETVQLYSKDPAIARIRVPPRYLADFLENSYNHNSEEQLLRRDFLIFFGHLPVS
jgi:hypothetical protein